MSATEPAFAEKEPLIWTDRQGDTMPTRRGVEFVSASGDHAVVRWNRENYTVPLSSLTRPAAPAPPPWLGQWIQTPKPPPIPTEEALETQLAERRAALQRAHQRAKEAQSAVEEARQIATRAGREVEQSRAALATLNRQDAANLAELENALRENRSAPPLRNGADRSSVQQHVDRAEAASTKLNGELSTAQAALGDALSTVRAAARAVLSVIFAREAELLRQAEIRCALQRQELTKVSQWWPTPEGHLSLPPATAGFIEHQPHWGDLPAVRQASGSLAPWARLHSRLVADGEAFADFELEK